MDVKKEKYCSVCFRSPRNGYKVIDNATSIILQVLTIELNADSSEELVLCQECADIANKSYDFKLISSNRINSSWVEKDGLRSKHTTASSKITETDILEEYTTCTLCTNRVKSDKVLSISILLNDPNIMVLYSRCMADIELDMKDIMICIPCRENFGAYLNFVRNYLEVKEKINMYFKNETFNGNTNQEKLRNIHNFLFRTATETSHVFTEMSEIKQELDKFEGYKYLEPPCEMPYNEEIGIKDETVVNMEEQRSQENVFEPTVHNLQIQSHNLNHTSNKIIYKPVICTYEKETQICLCVSCRCESKAKERLENQTVIHKNPSVMDTYKCNSCTYGTQRKTDVTKYKLAHSTIPDMQTYKCENCTFETNHKSNLKCHILTHKSIPEVKTYKCTSCTYKTNHKGNLKIHFLSHKDISEVETYKCDSCTYETKHKSSLKQHIITHKDISEVKMYKCESCAYETKHKCSLKQHVLTHKDISEVKTFKCENCTYETKRKGGLKRHILTHKDISEVNMYKCTSCTYEAKHKGSLKRHILTHNRISEVETYKCESCTYKTMHRSNLKYHKLTHKSISEVKTFKCASCTYATKRKGDLKQHVLTHKSILEVKTYKCESCTYETKLKGSLKRHILTHKGNSEIKTYK